MKDAGNVNRLGLPIGGLAKFGADEAMAETETLGYRPLYTQVRDQLVRRLVEGSWSPGMLIPSEMELARQLNVSQGTVRKALDTMTAENLLVRRQGRGTFVAQPEDSRILFQFFRLAPDAGEPAFPQSSVIRCHQTTATDAEAVSLEIAAKSPVWRIERLRSLQAKPVLVETITLPEARFPGFETVKDIPNNLYQLYSKRWGITIAQAEEKLKAIACAAKDAAHLGVRAGEPLLLIGRVARDLEGRPVELRWSRCLTSQFHYAVSLR